jgi:hypothetical protein
MLFSSASSVLPISRGGGYPKVPLPKGGIKSRSPGENSARTLAGPARAWGDAGRRGGRALTGPNGVEPLEFGLEVES